MPKRITLTVAVFSTLLLSSAGALAQDRTADAIIAEYEAVEMPSFDTAKRGDEAYREEYMKQRTAALEKRAALIGELRDADPQHEKLAELLPTRWNLLTGMFGDDKAKFTALMEELDAAAKANAGKPLGLEALHARAQACMRAALTELATSEELTRAVDAFVDAAPKEDERPARLMMSVAQRHTSGDEQLAAYRRVVERYGDTRTGKFAKGKLRQIEAVGKPYELQFSDAITGKSVSIAELKGKVVVVDFWATWCGPCVREMPHMKELYAEYKDKGVEFIGVSLDQPEDKGGLTKLREYCKENEIAWPQYYQGNYWDSEFSMSWGINSIPTMFVLDQDGKLYSTEARGKLDELLPKLLEKSQG